MRRENGMILPNGRYGRELGDLLDRPTCSGSRLNAVGQSSADHERDLLLTAEQQFDVPDKQNIPAPRDGDLGPRDEQGRVGDSKGKKHGKV